VVFAIACVRLPSPVRLVPSIVLQVTAHLLTDPILILTVLPAVLWASVECAFLGLNGCKNYRTE
jgi:hypothetical protein